MQDLHSILTVSDLVIGFREDIPVVAGVSFNLSAGKTLALVGESGSGKSMTALSLLKLLPGTAQLRSGFIKWNPVQGDPPVELNKLPERNFRQLRSKEIGMIFQEPLTALNPTKRIGNQLAESILGSLGVTVKKEINKISVDWLERVKLPDPARILAAYPHELSGGQRQRILIAMAMLAEPKLLIADEPTTALDTVTEAEIIRLLKDLTQEKNTALLFISHDLAIVRHLADEVILLKAGQVVERGSTEELFAHPKEEYTKELIRLSPRLSFTRSPELTDHQTSSSNSIELTEPALIVNGVSISYPLKTNWLGQPVAYLQAVKNVSFQLEKGEFVALVGESGCGKSSLMRGIAGLQPISSGEVLPVSCQVQIVFQDPFSSLNPVLSIGSVIAEVVANRHLDWSKEQCRNRTGELLANVELPADEFYDRLPNELSGGQRQRVAIARALAAEPEVLICDEAVSALDAALQSSVMELLQRIRLKLSVGILFISHDLALVSTAADRIFVMAAGKIVERATPAKLLRKPESAASEKLLSAILPR